MMMRRGFAVRIANKTMLTPEQAAIGQKEGEEFLFQLIMGEGENSKAFYFNRSGLDKLLRTFTRIDHWVKETIDVLDNEGNE